MTFGRVTHNEAVTESNRLAGTSPGGPVLSADAKAALSACADGRDHNEEAFALLIGAVRDWLGVADDWSADEVVVAADSNSLWDELLAGHDDVRGCVVEVRGVLAQRARLEDFWEDVEEWFIRLPDGRAICAFVVDPPLEVARGRGVRLAGFLYKRIDATDRAGVRRSYPAIVARVASIGPSPAAGTALFGVVIAMLGVFVLLRWRVGRRRRALANRSGAEPVLDGRPELPQDPAEALAALRHRSNESA